MIIYWNLKQIRELIANLQNNKFDVPIAICGNTGVGKSTLALRILRKMEGFNPKRDIIYSRSDLIAALSEYNRIIFQDEMINAGYKREFHNTDQQEAIKKINMFRDHRNVIIFCIPSFWDLDKDIRNSVRFRFDVVRRGEAIFHKRIESVTANDRWDSQMNQMIERKWKRREFKKPNWSELTTYKGTISFTALPPAEEEEYQKIKDEKRADLEKESSVVDEHEEEGFYERVLRLIDEGVYTSTDDLLALARANNIKYETLKVSMNNLLRNKGRESLTKQFRQKNLPESKRNLSDNSFKMKSDENKPQTYTFIKSPTNAN